MINLFLTYQCNLNCSYCFATGLATEFPKEISHENFDLFLDWLKEHNIPAIGILGGEPTMHSRFEEILARLGEIGTDAAGAAGDENCLIFIFLLIIFHDVYSLKHFFPGDFQTLFQGDGWLEP